MTHQIVAFPRPRATLTSEPAPLTRADVPRAQGTSVALAVALRYLATRRTLKRARQVAVAHAAE